MYIILEKEKFQRYFRHSEDKASIASTIVSKPLSKQLSYRYYLSP